MSNRDPLLEFIMPLEIVEVTSEADLSYVKNALIVVKPLDETTPLNVITACNTKGEVAQITASSVGVMLDNMSEIYIVAQNTIDLADISNNDDFNYFTVIIDKTFTDEERSSGNYGEFTDVLAISTEDRAIAKSEAGKKNHCAFLETTLNTGANMFKAFGALLGGRDWENQQYIEVPEAGVTTDKNLADALFDDRISFAMTSKTYENRLSFFAVGGKAIIAPYVLEILYVRLQSAALRWINATKPNYSLKNAKRLEGVLQQLIDEDFVETELLEYGDITVSLGTSNGVKNFVFFLDGDIADPTALWRVFGKLTQGGNV